MKFFLFAYEQWEASGGAYDSASVFDTPTEAEDAYARNHFGGNRAHIAVLKDDDLEVVAVNNDHAGWTTPYPHSDQPPVYPVEPESESKNPSQMSELERLTGELLEGLFTFSASTEQPIFVRTIKAPQLREDEAVPPEYFNLIYRIRHLVEDARQNANG